MDREYVAKGRENAVSPTAVYQGLHELNMDQ